MLQYREHIETRLRKIEESRNKESRSHTTSSKVRYINNYDYVIVKLQEKLKIISELRDKDLRESKAIKEKLNTLQFAYTSLNEKFTNVTAQLVNSEDNLTSLIAKYDKLNSDYKSIQSAYTYAQQKYEIAHCEYNSKCREYQQMKQEFHNMHQDYENIKLQITLNAHNFELLHDKLDTIEKDKSIETMQHIIKKKEQQIKNLNEQSQKTRDFLKDISSDTKLPKFQHDELHTQFKPLSNSSYMDLRWIYKPLPDKKPEKKDNIHEYTVYKKKTLPMTYYGNG